MLQIIKQIIVLPIAILVLLVLLLFILTLPITIAFLTGQILWTLLALLFLVPIKSKTIIEYVFISFMIVLFIIFKIMEGK